MRRTREMCKWEWSQQRVRDCEFWPTAEAHANHSHKMHKTWLRNAVAYQLIVKIENNILLTQIPPLRHTDSTSIQCAFCVCSCRQHHRSKECRVRHVSRTPAARSLLLGVSATSKRSVDDRRCVLILLDSNQCNKSHFLNMIYNNIINSFVGWLMKL